MNVLWLFAIAIGVQLIVIFLLYRFSKKQQAAMKAILMMGVIVLAWITYQGEGMAGRVILTVLCVGAVSRDFVVKPDLPSDESRE
jgi:hypothetical protein